MNITIEQLAELKTKLRAYGKKWVSELVELLQNDERFPEALRKEITATKVYNVFNNVVRDSSYQIAVYTVGSELLLDKEKTVSNLLSKKKRTHNKAA